MDEFTGAWTLRRPGSRAMTAMATLVKGKLRLSVPDFGLVVDLDRSLVGRYRMGENRGAVEFELGDDGSLEGLPRGFRNAERWNFSRAES